ncbi:MAG: hypothetical protein AB1306_01445 [Nitrospirota bacterium]
MVGIIIEAALLWLILFIVARHEAELDFIYILYVVMAISIGSCIMEWLLFPYVSYFVLILTITFSMIVLMRFCYISLGKALIVTACYIVAKVAIEIGLQRMFSIV